MGLLKTCTRCGVEKPRTAAVFPLHNKTKDGFDSWCRACRSSYRSGIRRGHYRAVISDDGLKELLSSTLECVICGDEFSSEARKVVDHDHESGEIRGVLCDRCNMGIGHFRDNPYLLEYARIYLLASKGDPEADEYMEAHSAAA